MKPRPLKQLSVKPRHASWPRAAAVPAVALLLGGCTVLGPNYERPAVSLPAAYPSSGTDSSAGTVSAPWWTLFADPQLDALIAKALAANTDIAQAVARVEQAEGVLKETSGATLPSLSLGSSIGRSRSSALAPGNPTGRSVTADNFALNLSTSFEIDFWGKVVRATESARAQLVASAAARDTVRLTVAGSVAQSWFALQSADAQIAATRRTLASRETSARVLAQRLAGGSGSRLDVEQAESQRADAAIALRELQRQRAATQTALGLLTADPALALPETPLDPARRTAALPPPGLPSALLERRPDIRRAEELLVAAGAQIGFARAAMFPTLSLTAGLGQQSTELKTLLDGPARLWNVGFGLALPLFDGGRNAARVEQAGARQREAVAAYQGAVSAAFKEVADALSNVAAARESQAELLLRDAASQRALKLAQARFDAGYSGRLEVLDAERSATASQLDVVRNRQALLAASVELMRALGGGWTAADLPR